MSQADVLRVVDFAFGALVAERLRLSSGFLSEKLDCYFKLALENIRTSLEDGTIVLDSSSGSGLVRATGEWDGYSQEFITALACVERALRDYAREMGK
jgi:hypothetical protein